MHDRNQIVHDHEALPAPSRSSDSRPAAARAVLRVSPLSGAETRSATSHDLSGLYEALLDADDRSDAEALAQIGWRLFTLTTAAQQAQRDAAALLSELRAAARAAAAGQGSPASLALLCHVLAMHGWLPPTGASPLQVLATPQRHLE